MRYLYGIRSNGSGGAVEPAFHIWNPSGGSALRVVRWELGCASTSTAFANCALRRTSTQGTGAAAAAPTSDNAFDRSAAPSSGMSMNMPVWTVVPTLGSVLHRFGAEPRAGSQFAMYWSGRQPIIIPPGTGLAWVFNVANAAGFDIALEWIE